MPRPTLQAEFEPLTAEDLDLLASRSRMATQPLSFLDVRRIVRVGRLQRHLNVLSTNAIKLDVSGCLGQATVDRVARVDRESDPVKLDPETQWLVERAR